MPRLLVLPLLAMLLLIGGCGSGGDEKAAAPAAFETVQPRDVEAAVAAGETRLVDVREPDEWDAGRAPKALHVPLATVKRRIEEIRMAAAGRPVAFICRSGNRSAQAAKLAVEGGLRDVVNVDGGMGGWVRAGLPIEPEHGRIL